MRLLKLGIYPQTYLRDFYQKRPQLADEPFATQHRALIADGFGSADFWTTALNRIGYETRDIIASAEPMQTRWAEENEFDFAPNDWLFEIARAQIKQFRPDVLLVADYSTFTADFLRDIRRECASIRLVLGWCAAPYNDSAVFREWDVALSCVPEMVAGFRAAGIRSQHVNHAFAPRILDQLDLESEPAIDFAFVGSIVKQNRFHNARERLLIELVETADLQIWAELNRPTFRERQSVRARAAAHRIVGATRAAGVSDKVLNHLPIVRKVAGWKSAPNTDQFVDARLARRAHAPIFGIEMFQKLRASRVVFNNHIDISPASASNMRLFEATGVGACLITDWKQNLPELFEPDAEVLTYRSAAECREKVGYILAHEPERRRLARAAQRRVLREHTFENRAARIDEIIRGVLTST